MDSNKKYMLIILGCLLFTIIIKIGAKFLNQDLDSKVTSPWTPEFRKNTREGMYKGLGDAFTDSDRNKIADCILGKLENKYPKGFDGFDKDSLEKQTVLLGEDCTKGMVLHLRWSKMLTNKIMDNAKESKWLKTVKEKNRNGFCNCYINHLKEMYPNGIAGSLAQSDIDSAVSYCKKQIQ